MSQERLNAAKIGTVVEQMGGEAVTEFVRCDMNREA